MKSNTRELIKFLVIAAITVFLVLVIMSLLHKPKIILPPRAAAAPARELRGVWMSRFDYTQSLNTHDKTIIQDYIRRTFRQIKDANCNTVFFQVRGNADAFYKSSYEPWSQFLTGTLGQEPGWDPLQFAIETAHEFDLELHAWINTFPAWRGKSKPEKSAPLHPYLAHPDWVICDSSGNPMPRSNHYVSFSPGNPDVRRHIKNVVMEITSKYDVDGIHFDYIRYPEGSTKKGYSNDAVSVKRLRSPKDNPLRLNRENWQREQISQFIAEAYNAITTLKPWVKVSTAVIGNYNMSGWSGYHKVFQDAARWAKIEKIDMIIPMTYRSRKNGDFQKSIQHWNNLQNIRQPIAPGLGVFNLPLDEVLEEIDDVRSAGLGGVVLFAASSVDSLGWVRLKNEKFQYPAIPPALPWKFKSKVPEPEKCQIKIEDQNIHFQWFCSEPKGKSNRISHFVIYRSKNDTIDTSVGESISNILIGSVMSAVKEIKDDDIDYNYFIVALDVANNESTPVHFIESTPQSSESQ